VSTCRSLLGVRRLRLPARAATRPGRGREATVAALGLAVSGLLFGSVAARGPVSVLASSSGSTPAGPWSQFQFDPGLSGYNPNERALTPGTIRKLRETWQFNTGNFVDSSPAVSGGTAYIQSDDGYLYAIGTANRNQEWAFRTANNGSTSSPAVSGGVVFVGTDRENSAGNPRGGEVVAVNAATGRGIWRFPVPEHVVFDASPTVVGDTVYIGSVWDYGSHYTGRLYALRVKTGRLRWSREVGEMYSSPAVANGRVYVTSESGNVFAFDAKTGRVIWKRSIDGGSGFFASPSVSGNMLFTAGVDRMVYGVNLKSGAVKWRYRLPSDDSVSSSLAVAKGLVFVADNRSGVYAIHSKHGTLAWKVLISRTVPYQLSSVAVAGGLAYVGALRGIYAVSIRTGQKVWHADTPGRVEAGPAVVDGTLYVSNEAGGLEAFEVHPHLGPVCIRRHTTVTCTFFQPGEHAWKVPRRVKKIGVVATGGSGGRTINYHGSAGLGAVASATVIVVPSRKLYVEVASDGSDAYGGRGGGGIGGGGDGVNYGGGGGGASGIQLCSLASLGCLFTGTTADPRLIVAGGGGGQASDGVDQMGAGSGGSAGLRTGAGGDGEPGAGGKKADSGGGGGGATEGHPGPRGLNAGSSSPTAGAIRRGGIGGGAGSPFKFAGGGGGGGGYFGGGGGGGGHSTNASASIGAGGGGGAGSSYVKPLISHVVTFQRAKTFNPSVVITYRK